MDGVKHDQEKDRWDLLPWGPIRSVVKVLTYGARKYAPENWRKVPDARNRYFAAAMRHLEAWWSGEKDDPESGFPHLAHVLCCVIFLLELSEDADVHQPTEAYDQSEPACSTAYCFLHAGHSGEHEGKGG